MDFSAIVPAPVEAVQYREIFGNGVFETVPVVEFPPSEITLPVEFPAVSTHIQSSVTRYDLSNQSSSTTRPIRHRL